MPKLLKKGIIVKNLVLSAIASSFILMACGETTATSPVYVVTPAQTTNLPAATATHSVENTPIATTMVSKLEKGVLTSIFPQLTKLPEAKSFRIQDDWNGLFGYSPIEAHYSFELKNNQFEGTADFRVNGEANIPLKASRYIKIPENIVQNFLQDLTRLMIEEGPYKPKQNHTDDYTSISIKIKVVNGKEFEVFTHSQDKGSVPWGVSYADRIFSVNSDAPSRALQRLQSYLQRDVLKELAGINPSWCGPGFPCP